MSERILKALMQLFAIVADVNEVTNNSRSIVQLFLKQQLNQEMVEEYLRLYDEYLEAHHSKSKKKDGARKRTSLNSVKVLRICTQINAELTQKQKVVVLIRIIEYVSSGDQITDQEYEFVETVAESFNISKPEFLGGLNFISATAETVPNSQEILLVCSDEKLPESNKENKFLRSESLAGKLVVLSIESVSMYILRYFGNEELYLNGQIMSQNHAYVLTQGSSIRSSKVNPIYYSDIITKFLADKSTQQIVFTADGIEYEFAGGKKGLHDLTFSEESGKLLGVMGGSGAGKSTLLNVLNGNNRPSKGSVTVNGISIHDGKDQIEGVVGYVSQDDLLIEELTVFENLFYNAKLCFDGHNDLQITKVVLKLLNSIGLYETKDLKVGSPLEKTISGGQRKRLNIALELIREPSVLFVDEPTSGLSSRDSENIMDLLKELALKGKIIFVVIHQPSSDIFKMFDKLLILDVGGYPIYYGNPVDSVIYFKTIVKHVKSQESECIECGNVNPEQVFNIIESKVLDEYGNLTGNRKISSKEWNALYREKLLKGNKVIENYSDVPSSTFKTPNKLKQFKVFLTRDVKSKLTNRQYLLINLLEAPTLALLLSVLVKYKNVAIGDEYVFRNNENLVAYIFMGVIVALFIGLTVSAEEIIRDQKIRKRESFLNLSKGSYLASKVLIMFVLSAVQSFSFVALGNLLLELDGLLLDYWAMLFSVSCFANMLGLNISASFNSAVTIYILIPFLLIPQLLLSGVIVKFEKLNPILTSPTHVPFWGNIMASRWAFEGLAVRQFKNNKFEQLFYEFDKDISITDFKKNFWISSMRAQISTVRSGYKKEEKKVEVGEALLVLKNEITKELVNVPQFDFNSVDKLTTDKFDESVLKELDDHIELLNRFYIKMYNEHTKEKDRVITTILSDPDKKKKFNERKEQHENESLLDYVKNKSLDVIEEVNGELIQRVDPIFLDPTSSKAHFFAPRKYFFGTLIDTYWFNMAVLWIMSITLALTLYFDLFRKLLEGVGNISFKKS